MLERAPRSPVHGPGWLVDWRLTFAGEDLGWEGALATVVEAASRDGQLPPLVTPPGLRVGVRRLVEPRLPRLPVISLGELPAHTPIQNLTTWELSHAA